MEWPNTTVTEFVLLGLAKSWEVQTFLFFFFLLVYLATLFSNLLIISTIVNNPHLWDSPMFFLLAHLAFLDVCLPSFATPNYLFGFLAQHQTISFNGCMAQIFCLHLFTGSEMLLLTAMAYDRYMAISQPLHYKTLMSRCLCTGLVLASWAGGLLHASVQLVFTLNVPFCGPNRVDSFFCDIPLVINLACVDSYSMDVMMVTNSGILSLVSFVALLISYGLILFIIFSQAPSGGTSKAISTCTSHLIVVTMCLGPCLFIYLRPYARFEIDKVLSVFYTCITPLLNPAVYALKNKEMKAALRRILVRHSGQVSQKSRPSH